MQREDYLLENETPEQAFERIMGIPYDPTKYNIRIGEGAMDDGYDNPVNTIQIEEKEAEYTLNPVKENEPILENETPEQAFERIMGMPFDPEKYEITQGDGAMDDGYDNPINTITISEKVPTNTKAQDEPEVALDQPVQSNVDEVIQNYTNSGYGQNAYGWYYNPNIDEYDESYDPHNDPLFNKDVKPLVDTESETELFRQYAEACNEMGQILGVDPYPGIDLADFNDISYQLDDSEKDRFMELIDVINAINEKDSSIKDKYTDEMNNISAIRGRMGELLGLPPYPGIENENIHDIGFQLDDNEKDEFAELSDKLSIIKSEHPELFRNVRSNREVMDNSVQTRTVPTPTPAPSSTDGSSNPADDGSNPGQPPSDTVGDLDRSNNVVPIVPVPGDTSDTPENTEENEAEAEENRNKDLEAEIERLKERLSQVEREKQAIEKRHNLLKKALAASGGFVLGVGLSCVPGVGTIRMAMAATKLVASGINLWAKKHPDGKIAQAKDYISAKFNEKCPNIAAAVNKIKAKMKEVPLNAFINGVSAGYITGNIYELLAGETVLDSIKGAFDKDVTNVVDAAKLGEANLPDNVPGENAPAIENTSAVTGAVTDTPTMPSPEEIAEMVKSGQGVDISGLEMGKVSSDAQNAVHLIQEAGKDATFLKEVVLPDGTKMWAFNQANGLGYAWFNADDIINYLGENAPEITSGIAR